MEKQLDEILKNEIPVGENLKIIGGYAENEKNYSMNNLEKLLKETNYSGEEWEIFKKVEKNNRLEDLRFVLDEMLEDCFIDDKQYKLACKNAEAIIERFETYGDEDWHYNMRNAIFWAIKSE